jgi:hypothetical protein
LGRRNKVWVCTRRRNACQSTASTRSDCTDQSQRKGAVKQSRGIFDQRPDNGPGGQAFEFMA